MRDENGALVAWIGGRFFALESRLRVEKAGSIGAPCLVGAIRAEVEGQDASFGAGHLDGGGRGQLATQFAAARSARSPASEREQLGGREFVVVVTVEATPTEPHPTIGALPQVGHPGDGLRRAKVARDHWGTS